MHTNLELPPGYEELVTPLIQARWLNDEKDVKYEKNKDILDPENPSPEFIAEFHGARKRKQKTGKYGNIWQVAIGNFPGWKDLGTGHESGCDIAKLDGSAIGELKNAKGTCKGSDIKNSILEPLSRYKERNRSTMCFWGVVNEECDKPTKTHSGTVFYKQSDGSFVATHNGQEIEKRVGRKFLSWALTYEERDYSEAVISLIKKIMNH